MPDRGGTEQHRCTFIIGENGVDIAVNEQQGEQQFPGCQIWSASGPTRAPAAKVTTSDRRGSRRPDCESGHQAYAGSQRCASGSDAFLVNLCIKRAGGVLVAL